MGTQISVRYDRALVRRALLQFFLVRTGGFTLAVYVMLCVYVAVSASISGWDAFLTVLASGLGVAAALLVWIYSIRMAHSESFLTKAKEPVVRFTFDEDGMTTSSDLGHSSLRWDVFDEVIIGRGLWLLVYGKSGYVTLPEESLPDEVRALIRKKVRSAT